MSRQSLLFVGPRECVSTSRCNANINRMDDPWGSSLSAIKYPIEKFEDNFVLDEHLPDSKQYLEILEKKLAKLKSQGSSVKELLKGLSKTKESHLERIIDSSSTSVLNDPYLDQPVALSTLQRIIAPEKQAHTVTELYELIKYDQLGQLFEELEKEKENLH